VADDSEDSRLPFVHELLGIGIWMTGVVAILIYLDPAGTTYLFAFLSLILATVGGFVLAIIPFMAVGVYFRLVLGIEVSETEPTFGAFLLTILLTLLLTAIFRDPATVLLDSFQPGTTGDHPLRKGVRAVTLMTAGCAAFVAEILTFSLLQLMDIDTVNPRAES
jgi:hypothetical protein